MHIVQWQNQSLRVTQSDDVFYNRPLAEMTLYRFTSSDVFVEPHGGALSLKFVLAGSEHYEFHRRHVRIRPAEVLLVNAGEIYASRIDEPSESLSVFYLDCELEDAIHATSSAHEVLLEQPDASGVRRDVPQIPLRMNPSVFRAFGRLVASIDELDEVEAESMSRQLLACFLVQSRRSSPPDALANVVKRSTRDELLARTYVAKHYIDDTGGRHVCLDELARIARMSKYHFLRVFGEVFAESPMSYARRLRLENAREALLRGKEPASVARRAGYGDLRAFRRAYRRVLGELPGRANR